MVRRPFPAAHGDIPAPGEGHPAFEETGTTSFPPARSGDTVWLSSTHLVEDPAASVSRNVRAAR
jgi:hypothetical protein